MPIAKHLEAIEPSYIREILKVANSDSVISLAGGLPAVESFPMEIIEGIMASLGQNRLLFQYSQTAGHQPLLDDLRERFHVPASHEVLVTTGSQQGLDLCARAFLNVGDTIVAEEPCYLGALQVFAIAQAKVVTITQQVDGPDLEQLEQAFASGQVKLFYAVPDFHNPSGRCWSLEKRRQVAALCQKHNIVLLEDAPYRDLRFSGEQLPLVSEFCPEHSIILHSFSKSIVPGIRVAAMVLPQRWSDAVTKIKQASDLHSNVPMQELVLQLLNHPDYPRHLQATTELYRSRYEILAGELQRQLDPGSSFEPVAGGMFIWLQLPGADSMALAAKALKQGLAVVPSASFYANATDKPAALRLNFSHTAPAEIPEAVQRLKRVIAM